MTLQVFLPDPRRAIRVPAMPATARRRQMWLPFLLTLLVLSALTLSARAAEETVTRSDVKYYAPTGSYFQHITDFSVNRNGMTWEQAKARAQQMTYKGRAGRLAVVHGAKLHNWLIQNFELRSLGYGGNSWIGLRYWCGVRVLSWVSGEEQGANQFGPWAVPWYRGDVTCSNNRLPYMGVYYAGDVGRWQAVGPAKHFPHYFVEYPAPDAEQGDQEQSAAAPTE